jgi:hypothetical protein
MRAGHWMREAAGTEEEFFNHYTVEGEIKLREAKATTLGIVLHARSRAMGGEDVVGEVKGVEEVIWGERDVGDISFIGIRTTLGMGGETGFAIGRVDVDRVVARRTVTRMQARKRLQPRSSREARRAGLANNAHGPTRVICCEGCLWSRV